VRELTAVAMPEYDKPTLATTERGNWKALYSHDVPASRFIDIADDTIIMCKELGAHVAGFATNSNPFFRSKKFRSIGYVVGKLMLWHNVPFTWDHTVSMEDFRNTAEQTLLHGAVCINNYVFPVAGHYEAGGMGPYDARVAHRLDDVQRLLLRYPGFFRVRNRKGFVRNTDLAVRMTNAKQVAYWRAGMRA
jgi:hypothetical protein